MTDRVRCAIYTRKSSEEGLEQAFNSLEAQREAATAYILSQKHEGWTVLDDRYDDGGFSGGSMDRPALQQLLSDIQAGKVDIIVVYKVDRLTRSLIDFSKIIEVLDAHKVSFVSVTQQFNTTTSMGRLTLNVLLSFAQFEREITGERIRDKVRASKQKGMWMGGVVPLGYDKLDRQLVINPAGAESVREIFETYLRLGSVTKLKEFLDEKDNRSKVWTSKTGRIIGGALHSRGSLYHLLSSRVYRGEIVHKDQVYLGKHEAIISKDLWDRVASRLKENHQGRRVGKSQSTPGPLTGRVFDTSGVRFTPTHAVKNGKRYRYYTSQSIVQRSAIKPTIDRLPAEDIEKLVKSQIQSLLLTPENYMSGLENNPSKNVIRQRTLALANRWPQLEIAKQDEFMRKILDRVTVGEKTLWIEIQQRKLLEAALEDKAKDLLPPSAGDTHLIKLTADFAALRRRGELKVIGPNGGSHLEAEPAHSLIKVVARARNWYERIIAGEITSIDHLAQQTGLSRRYVRKVLQCANLSPEVMEALVTGRHRTNLTFKQLLERAPLDWQEQKKRLLNEVLR